MGRKLIMAAAVWLGLLTWRATAQIPQWATDQLQVRDLIKQSVVETQKWQRADGAIYPYLSTYKWDDETEIFYFWLCYYYLTGDESVYQSVKGIAKTYIRRAETAGMFEHGYYRDKFYDTEHTLEGLFILGSLVWARPNDAEVVNLLRDIVEHAANLVPGYEPWFNEQTSLLRSLRPGTRSIDQSNMYAVDWPFNLQLVKMALATYHATKDDRFLNWARRYVYGWIDIMAKNEAENGFYVIPASVDPYTKQIGPYSGLWWQAKYEPGWGWHEKGNNAMRDIRGAFMDYFRLTGDRKPLEALKKHVQTLFDNGSATLPALTFDGQKWIAGDDKITVWQAVEVSLRDGLDDDKFEEFMWKWYGSVQYPETEMQFWAYRKKGGEDKIRAINSRAINNARTRLNDLKALTVLPAEADDFPQIGGHWGVTLVPFGGIAAQRGEMPWQEVVYFKADKSLGLEEGLAALFENTAGNTKSFYICNTTTTAKTLWVQSGYVKESITQVTVDGAAYTDIQNSLIRLNVPAGKTSYVRFSFDTVIDNTPPTMVNSLRIVGDEN